MNLDSCRRCLASYVIVPYPDWITSGDRARSHLPAKVLDVFPIGRPGGVPAGVGAGSTVYIAGAGPIGLAAAEAAFSLGASAVIVGDADPDRRARARRIGCRTLDLTAWPSPDPTGPPAVLDAACTVTRRTSASPTGCTGMTEDLDGWGHDRRRLDELPLPECAPARVGNTACELGLRHLGRRRQRGHRPRPPHRQRSGHE
ncbi:hypothetical protein ACVGVM_19195 [Pseudonocardia bannensis]|uniref:Alcohol dehydrogenase-like C-terminal domain-containing protein n=1 Tax=Pseudonocardia bannensis TaxID=630973 RepID=A0A848DIZ0_9PSEU|nr:hypothetical protein [Pseudonocardia bannensis]NMH92658.1 hypothetical protein [Pseudonocardia bannensis]